MQSWPAAAVPTLSGRGPGVRLHDTASGTRQPAAPGPAARLYVCGITPYDATHLGHAATYVAFDLLVRAWLDEGLDVHYVQNVTDVDDPLLERAAATGTAWRDLAERETALFRSDMTALRVLPPTAYVGVTESVELIAGVVERLQQRGHSYDLGGDVYFPVSADPRFGEVSGLGPDEMRELSAERGGDPDRPGKKDPLDPVLWLGVRGSEPSWPSALGPGRPGWHVECTAIALQHLGSDFDVQGGGSDLAFPHHEMSASQAQALTGEPFARLYAHAGMVGLDGEKMSKSRGNLVFVHALLAEGHPGSAVRLALLAHHYRSDWTWTRDGLVDAEARLVRWRAAVTAPAGPPAEPVVGQLRAALADDLDAPVALRAVDAWVDAVARDGGDERAAPRKVADAVDALLGVDLR